MSGPTGPTGTAVSPPRRLALLALYDGVVSRFASEGATGVTFRFGRREPERYLPMPRVTFYPGDQRGMMAIEGAPKYPGRNPRPLVTVTERFTIVIESHDGTTDLSGNKRSEVERAQYEEVRGWFDYLRRCLYLESHQIHSPVNVLSLEWINTNRAERRFGTALQLTCSVDAMIPDVANFPASGEATDVTWDEATLEGVGAEVIELDETKIVAAVEE